MGKWKISWPSAVVLAFLAGTGVPSGGASGGPSRTASAAATAKQGTGSILGILRGGIFCNQPVPGVAVSLGTYDGRMSVTDTGGLFSFSDLEAGTYVLAANTDYCELSLCFPRPAVDVVEGTSTLVHLCEVCPSDLHISPSDAQPGMMVKAVGRCSLLPSNGTIDVFVDDVQVDAMVQPVNGVYESAFLLPEDFHAGAHYVRATSDIDLPTVAWGAFEVVQEPVPCAADCNGDNVVTIDEAVTALRISLRQSPVGSCVAADLDRDQDVRIDELIRAVEASVRGCTAE